jgi:hypothetical protein
VLTLEVVRASAPAVPRRDGPNVETWLDSDGSPAAYGGSVDGQHWMLLPRVGSFWFSNAAETVEAYPDASVANEIVADSFRRIVLPMALQARGREVLHASGVLGPAGVVALCAVSETGKSTLAFGLSRRGFPLWADDAVAFEARPDGVLALPLPFSMRLRPQSAAHFGYDGSGEAELGKPAALAVVCVLERLRPTAAEPVEIERLDTVAAFPAVLAHAYCFALTDADRKEQMVREYMELTSRVPVFRVRLREGLDQLGEILDAIEAAIM